MTDDDRQSIADTILEGADEVDIQYAFVSICKRRFGPASLGAMAVFGSGWRPQRPEWRRLVAAELKPEMRAALLSPEESSREGTLCRK